MRAGEQKRESSYKTSLLHNHGQPTSPGHPMPQADLSTMGMKTKGRQKAPLCHQGILGEEG